MPETDLSGTRQSRAPNFWAALSLAFILALTLRPSASGGAGPATCVLCGERGGADLLLNVILFLPLGAALGRLGWRPVLVAGIGLALALGIEFAQLVIPGRFPTWRDIVLNAIGAGLGAWMAIALTKPMSTRLAATLALSCAAAISLVVAFTAWALTPQVRRSEWYAHVNPRLGHLVEWVGRVEEVRIGGEVSTPGRLSDPGPTQDRVTARAPIELRAVFGDPPTELAGLFVLSDGDYEEMLLIGIEDRVLVLRERRRASTIRLFEPEMRIPEFFDGLRPGDPFTITVELDRYTACASLNGQAARCSAPFAASSAWTLVLWRRWLGPDARRVLGAMTFFALALPVGFFAATAGRAVLGASGVLAALGPVTLAPLSGLAAVQATEVLSLVVGVAVGALLSYLRRRAAMTSS